jgi:hypothetical protein
MQKAAFGHDTVVAIPGYSLASGITRTGADHPEPFQVTTPPAWSAATQKEAEGHEMESSSPSESMVCSADHGPPSLRTDTPFPFTTAHHEVVGQEMAVGSVGPVASLEVQGDCSWDQLEPFQSRMDEPTTAVHSELVGQETPTRPAW